MGSYRKKSFSWVFVSRMIGIICFLIVVVLAKILTTLLPPEGMYYKALEGILFANFWLLLLIAIIFFIADIFDAFPFPLNLPFPIIKAFGSIFCIAFILNVFKWIDGSFSTFLFPLFWLPALILIPLLFLLVLASGYVGIMRHLWRQSNLETDTDAEVVHQVRVEETEQPVSDVKSWEEIGAEFRMMLYDIIHRFRQEIKKKQ
ncbi:MULTISPECIES: hypothetical protein [unclassified Methanoregula]|uniref:hypothetical protein n=1 Tax=unclassified Methanoregula TaxID=2649730 RepID=UPI0025F0005E|nr:MULTISPECIES: hypothetical protein [unclassified Methanoregula]